MTARLFIREVGQTRFEQHNGDFPDSDAAYAEGERMCREGNVESFEIWRLVAAFNREWNLAQTAGEPHDRS